MNTDFDSSEYIPYPKALKILREKYQAAPEELAAWIFMGKEEGGISAYLNANELSPPPRFYFNYDMGEDYLPPIMACWFLREDIERFDPSERYITGAALIKRWSKQPGIRVEAFIRAKIGESRLIDIHPTFGGTQGTFSEETNFPPLSAGLFPMSMVLGIEVEDALDPFLAPSYDDAMIHCPVDAATTDEKNYTSNISKREARKRETQRMHESWQTEYRKLKREKPGKNDRWYSLRIAKMDIANGRNAETIRKNMKK